MTQKDHAMVEADGCPTNIIQVFSLSRCIHFFHIEKQIDYHLHVGSSCGPNHKQRMCEGLVSQHILLTAAGVPALFLCALTLTNHLTKLLKLCRRLLAVL